MTLETRYYKLEKLVKWERIDELNQMLIAGISPRQAAVWCKDNGFEISHPKLYEYKDILQEAIAKQITVERMLGIGAPRRSPIVLQALGVTPVKDLVKSEMEVLDGIIQLGFNALAHSPTIRLQDAMKAIELKNKLTGGGHGGLTNYGLDQLRELEQAKFSAILEVVLSYLPEDKHEEVYQAMAKAEHEFYEERAPQFLEEYEKTVQEELAAMRDNDDIIVSDTKF